MTAPEVSMTSVPHLCQKYTATPDARSPPRLFPHMPSSQAMAVSRGSCRGVRPLAPTYAPSPVLAVPSHAHPYPHGLPAKIATLPAPINCTYSRSKWAVRSCWTRITIFEHLFLFQKFQIGWERVESVRLS